MISMITIMISMTTIMISMKELGAMVSLRNYIHYDNEKKNAEVTAAWHWT